MTFLLDRFYSAPDVVLLVVHYWAASVASDWHIILFLSMLRSSKPLV